MMTEEGFLVFYQGDIINSKLQDQIDDSCRIFISASEQQRLNVPFLPLS